MAGQADVSFDKDCLDGAGVWKVSLSFFSFNSRRSYHQYILKGNRGEVKRYGKSSQYTISTPCSLFGMSAYRIHIA